MLPARLAAGVNRAVLPVTLTVPLTAAPPVIASEKLADTEEFSATPLAPLAGEVEDTVGGVVSGAAAVVKVQLTSAASALPAASVTLLVTVAVYCVLASRATEGVNRAVLPLMLTVPATAAPPAVLTRVKLVVVSVALVIASEKLADTEAFVATPVAAFAGEVEDTVGGVVSEAAPVVNCQVKLAASALPAASFAAVVMVAVYCVPAARLPEGTNSAVVLLVLTVPLTAAPPAVGRRVKLAVLSVERVIASEKVTETEELNVTPVAALSGDVSDTVGGVVSEGITGALGAALNPGDTTGSPWSWACPPQPDRPRLASTAA